MRIKYGFIIVLLTAFSLNIFATHIVGGEIFYDYLRNNNYRITLKVYRDCYSGVPPFDYPAYVSVYDSNGNLVQQLNMGAADSTLIPSIINNPCLVPPTNVCVREGVYTDTVNLPPIPGGYILDYQRCCRNASILNIVNASNTGSTYTISIPGTGSVWNNSSPHFNHFPPLFLCEGVPLHFDNSATDPNGDSLHYEFCDAYDGGSTTNPTPIPPGPPPFPLVAYQTPYSATYPMSSSPALTINPNTGMITGTPTMIGRWVVAVCVSEYRNGVLLSTNKRDFQFNVVNCPNLPVASIVSQQVFCFGNTVQFTQTSLNAFSYHWDFGDNSTLADTANAANPTWTYPDSGTYTVTLIINEGTQCADTNHSTFYIQHLLNPSFVVPPAQCVNGNHYDFIAAGSFQGNGTFAWDFGVNANPQSSNQQNPVGVIFNLAGTFPVTLTISENGCTQSYTDNVVVNPNPVAAFSVNAAVTCALTPVYFTNTSQSTTAYTSVWNFGNGNTSTDANPSTIYQSTGTYNVALTITNQFGCKDSVSHATNINISPLPEAGFILSPKDTSIFYPVVTMVDQSIDAIHCQVFWGDGTSDINCNIQHTYASPGIYHIMQIVTNAFGCPDTALSEVIINAEFRFWIPNAFTPNGDGTNEVFKPIVFGVHDYLFQIFDRWGQKLFETDNLNYGWNGFYHGRLCAMDVFVYKVTFTDDVEYKTREYIGKVTLVR